MLSGVKEFDWDLSVTDGMALAAQTADGAVIVGSPTVVGNEVLYDVDVTLPLDWNQHIWNPDYPEVGPESLGDLTATGTLTMSGTLTTLLPILGDADLNGVVDELDAAEMADNWLAGPGATWAMGDFTADGYVNDADVTWLAANWNGTGPAPASVPEPTSLATLLALALAGLALWRR